MPQNKLLTASGCFFIFLLIFLYCSQVKADEIENEESSCCIDINKDTVWRKDDNLAFNKAIFVNPGATLTIEKGAQIKLGKNDETGDSGYIFIGGGRIIANGTQEEPIKITSLSPNTYYLMEFRYDRWDGIPEAEPSFLRYVEMSGGGHKNETECPYCTVFRYFIPSVYAYFDGGMPAVYFTGGKAHMENCTFSNSEYADIGVEYQENENNAESYLEIINSNFEKSGDSLAVKSEMSCKIAGLNCMKKVLLKNNWYDGSCGPIEETAESNADGKELMGVFYLDSWRTNDMIADPAIIIPGIMGSMEVKGEWKLDPILHAYDDLMESLEKNRYEKNINLFEFPYNWRNKNEDSAQQLKNKIESVINSTKISKVDLIAHSMGGLIARSYIEGNDYQNNIDQLITLGTPHRGSPESYLKWEAGEGFFTRKEKIAKHHFEMEALHNHYNNLYSYIQEQVPSIKELLPDYDYLFDVSQNSMRDYPNNYPKNTFLENLNKESSLEKLKNVDFINIAGVLLGKESTISKLRVVNSTVEGRWDNGMPENFYNKKTDRGLENSKGDETVPEKSAEDVLVDETVKIDSSHQDLPTEAQCIIFQELTEKDKCEEVKRTHIPNILLINVFSPIDIQIIDPDGNKIGKDFSTGKEFNEIPGAFYTGYDTENEFITVPNPIDGEYKILTQGTGNGEYKIEAAKISENENNSSEAIESIAEITGTAVLDGQKEFKITITGDTVGNVIDEVIDKTPPITTIIYPENNQIYTNNQILEIKYTATDETTPSDKIKTELFFDGQSLDPKNNSEIDLSLEHLGMHTVSAVAEDEAGNKSEEAKITFESKTDISAIINNVNHYFDLNLIVKKSIKQLLAARLNVIKVKIELLKVFQNKKFPNFAKEKMIEKMEKEINREIEKLISDIQNKKNFSENIDEKIKELLIEGVGSLKL